MPPVYDPQKYNKIDGKSSNAGNLGPAAILNQNPIFEMGSNKMAYFTKYDQFGEALMNG